ncbi:MAG: PEP-CTERM sorting domain-containing protein [Bryobacterales bacterium]|nr:PEP-CTERM sorting domain-containing protein [Bryobacterales bacterium]
MTRRFERTIRRRSGESSAQSPGKRVLGPDLRPVSSATVTSDTGSIYPLSAVPEPGTISLLAIGLAVTAVGRAFRRRF